jgi:hypothetical protein
MISAVAIIVMAALLLALAVHAARGRYHQRVSVACFYTAVGLVISLALLAVGSNLERALIDRVEASGSFRGSLDTG